jgi:hypothetical protein
MAPRRLFLGRLGCMLMELEVLSAPHPVVFGTINHACSFCASGLCDRQHSPGTAGTDSASWRCRDAGSVCSSSRGGGEMSAEKYRRNAAECFGLATFVRAERPRWMLLQMAIAWSELAEQAERNRKNDIVYETPPPPSQNG